MQTGTETPSAPLAFMLGLTVGAAVPLAMLAFG